MESDSFWRIQKKCWVYPNISFEFFRMSLIPYTPTFLLNSKNESDPIYPNISLEFLEWVWFHIPQYFFRILKCVWFHIPQHFFWILRTSLILYTPTFLLNSSEWVWFHIMLGYMESDSFWRIQKKCWGIWNQTHSKNSKEMLGYMELDSF
jgi:hypothetical protein